MATLTPKMLVDRIWNERLRLVTFFVVGISSLGLNLGLYALLSRVIWPAGPRTLENAIVVVIVTAANFEANRHFTFAKQRSVGAVFRFGMVAVFAMVLNSLLFWIGHAVFGLYDMLVIIMVTAVIAFFTFASHRLFTFHDNPWRHVRRLKRRDSQDGSPLQ